MTGDVILAEKGTALDSKFRIMADCAPVLLWMTGRDARCIFFNKFWLNFTGRTLEEEIGYGWAEGIHAEDFQLCMETFLDAFNQNKPFAMEYRLRRWDNEYRWVLDNGVPYFDANSNFQGYIGSCIDITEQKEANRLIRRSEEHYRTITELIPELVWTANNDGEIEYFNQRWFELTGQSPSATQNWQWSSAIHPQDRVAFLQAWQKSFEAGEPFAFECRLKKANGPYFWHLAKATALKSFDRQTIRWFGTFTNVDGNRRALERDRVLSQVSGILGSSLNQKNNLRSVADLVLAGFADWYAITLSHKSPELPESLVGAKDPSKLVLAREIQRTLSKSNLPLMAERIGAHAYVSVPISTTATSYGTMAFLSYEEEPFSAEDQRFFEDVGERIAFSLENTLLYRDVEEANRLKDDFLASVSHELRTPLGVIMGHAQLLGKQELNEEAEESVRAIEDNGKIQIEIVDKILSILQIIDNKMEIKPTTCNIKLLVERAAKSLEYLVNKKNLHIALNTGGEPLLAQVDERYVFQMLRQLLENAIKFSKPHGLVEVFLLESEPFFTITIADQGVGIEPAFIPQIFEKFRQEDSSIRRGFGGLGLGLTLVKHIVELHHGKVVAESKGKGQGARFSVMLPTAAVEAKKSKSKPTTSDEKLLKGVKVAVLEDDEATQTLIKRVLTRAGAEVQTYYVTETAYEGLPTFTPDILLCDIGLPGEDGYTFIRKIRQIASYQTIPAIALTAYAMEKDREEALRSGYQLHIAKPFDGDHLVQAISKLVGEKST